MKETRKVLQLRVSEESKWEYVSGINARYNCPYTTTISEKALEGNEIDTFVCCFPYHEFRTKEVAR